MAILRRKCSSFPNKTPILFELEMNRDISVFYIENTDNGEYNPLIADKIRLDRRINNWTSRGYSGIKVKCSYGLIYTKRTIALALRDDISNKMEIYCSREYFSNNEFHKKYINKFARENNISVRKDIFYIDDESLVEWSIPFRMGLEFYDDETQDKTSEELFNKMKLIYLEPIIEKDLSNVIPGDNYDENLMPKLY